MRCGFSNGCKGRVLCRPMGASFVLRVQNMLVLAYLRAEEGETCLATKGKEIFKLGEKPREQSPTVHS